MDIKEFAQQFLDNVNMTVEMEHKDYDEERLGQQEIVYRYYGFLQ